jgi:tetratricopeptide (TPR) repeat protein
MRTAAWQLVGLTQVYLGDYDRAVAAFLEALEQAPDAALRAQTCYYIGLIRAKRQDRLASGREWFERGLKTIEGRHAEPHLLERGWLWNGLGFVAWRRGRHDDARRLIERALVLTEGRKHPQLANLRVNLINNLSLLLEERGRFAEALEVWRQLAEVAALPGLTAAKSYHYREGWLLMLQGHDADAAGCYERAFEAAARFRDYFHMDLISRAAGYLACRRHRYDEASQWYERDVRLREKLCDGRSLPYAWASCGHVALQAGQVLRAQQCWQIALDAALAVGDKQLERQLLEALQRIAHGYSGTQWPSEDEAFSGILLEKPKAKLTTPFHLGHLSTDSAFVPELHQMALRTV